MKKIYGAKCRECGEAYEQYCDLNTFESTLMTQKCTSCGGELRRDWVFGGYQLKTGATRKPT